MVRLYGTYNPQAFRNGPVLSMGSSEKAGMEGIVYWYRVKGGCVEMGKPLFPSLTTCMFPLTIIVTSGFVRGKIVGYAAWRHILPRYKNAHVVIECNS